MAENQQSIVDSTTGTGSLLDKSSCPSTPFVIPPSPHLQPEEDEIHQEDEEEDPNTLSPGQEQIQRRFSQIWGLCRATHDPYGHSTVDYWMVIDALGKVGDISLNVYPTHWGGSEFHKAKHTQKLPPANCMVCRLHFRRCTCSRPTMDSRMTRLVLGGIKEEAEFLCIRTAIFRLTGIVISLCHRISGMVFVWVQTHLADTLYTMIHQKVWWSPLGVISAKTVAGYEFLTRILNELRAQNVRCPFPRHAITVGPATLQGRGIGPSMPSAKSTAATSRRLLDDTHMVAEELDDAASKTLHSHHHPFTYPMMRITNKPSLLPQPPYPLPLPPPQHGTGKNNTLAPSDISWDKIIAPPPTITIGISRTPLPLLTLPEQHQHHHHYNQQQNPLRTTDSSSTTWGPYQAMTMMNHGGNPSASSSSSAAQSMPSATFPHLLQNMEVSSCEGSSTTTSTRYMHPPTKHDEAIHQHLNLSEMEG